MIAHDHGAHKKNTVLSFATSALIAGLALSCPLVARADDAAMAAATQTAPAAETLAPAPAVAPADAQAAREALPAHDVTLDTPDGRSTFSTRAVDVAALLNERGVTPAAADFIFPALATPLEDGMHVVFRSAVNVGLIASGRERYVRTAALDIRELLREQHVVLGRHDLVSPALDSAPLAHSVVRVTRVTEWTVHERRAMLAGTRVHDDATLARGTSLVEDRGATGLQELSVRFVRRDNARAERTVLAARIIRAPRTRVVARGIAEYRTLATVAEAGFKSALSFAGTALHMIATAYTAGCYGCSGITASGLHAGFGIIAVDPSVIPLGTKLFIPGYGRAVAGDTGGAIRGHRVDLGMDSVSEALRFGRRPITVYVLR